MNKIVNSKTRYCIQWEQHSRFAIKGLCSLMEHQSLVDIAICCGNHTLHAHKCILAAGSPMFKEAFEKNSLIEQVIINGCDFTVMKSIIEIMYCGETTIGEEYVKYLVAAAKLFQMKALENLFSDRNEYHFAVTITGIHWTPLSAEEVFLPQPQFLTKKPKYPTAYNPLNHNSTITNSNNILKSINYNLTDPFSQRKFKRKYVRVEAEKACAKEAQASRMALANLQKEIASAPQVNSFIIEDSCTETTVENFIPHTDDSFDKLELQQIQMVNYSDLDNSVYVPQNQFLSTDTKPQNLVQFSVQTNNQGGHGLMTDKIKHILGHDVPSNVEIMFKTSEGNFVTVTEEVLQNISKGGLQYQVVDENGQVGEIRELQVIEREKQEKSVVENSADEEGENNGGNEQHGFNNFFVPAPEIGKAVDFLTINENIFACPGYDGNKEKIVAKIENIETVNNDVEEGIEKVATATSSLKFSPDIFFADMPTIENVADAKVTESIEKNNEKEVL